MQPSRSQGCVLETHTGLASNHTAETEQEKAAALWWERSSHGHTVTLAKPALYSLANGPASGQRRNFRKIDLHFH
jgi:hypothetical protein